MMKLSKTYLGDLQGGLTPLFHKDEGASDIQRLVIGRVIASE
jgi:hypothetical protein